MEKSVASEILALLEPEQPTIDREVRELLPRYGFYPLPESPLFDECVAYHRELRDVMMLVIELPAFGRLEARFDQAIGPASASLSRLRKFNLQLSGSYRTVALMPNLEAAKKVLPRRIGVAPEPLRGADPADRRPSGRAPAPLPLTCAQRPAAPAGAPSPAGARSSGRQLADQQVLQQRLLHVEPVLGFVPDDRLRCRR